MSDMHTGNVERSVKHILSMSNCLLTDNDRLSTEWELNDQDFYKVKQDVFSLQ